MDTKLGEATGDLNLVFRLELGGSSLVPGRRAPNRRAATLETHGRGMVSRRVGPGC